MISFFSVTSLGTNRSVQQVCQLIAGDRNVCSHLPLCASGYSVNVVLCNYYTSTYPESPAPSD